uniref:Uncharacterized protein n=1 Tax=Rhizophora mucronata TaxID=61149 RepID=A0A2P2J012_RHIMU
MTADIRNHLTRIGHSNLFITANVTQLNFSTKILAKWG